MWWINEKMMLWICFACMFKCLRVCVLRSYHTKRSRLNGAVQRADERVMNEKFEEIPCLKQRYTGSPHTDRDTRWKAHVLPCGTLWELTLLLNLLNAVCILQVNPCKIQLTYYSVQPIHIISHNATLFTTCHSQCDSQSWFLLTIIQLDCQQLPTGLNNRWKLSILQWHIKQNHFGN